MTVEDKVLGVAGIDFETYDSIEIISSRPAFLEPGKKVDGAFVFQIQVSGINQLKERTEERTVERTMVNLGSSYQIMGSGF